MRYVVPFRETGCADVERVGRKAAVLADLVTAGYPVPAGWVVTVDALRACLATDPPAGDDPATVRAHVAGMAFPGELVAEVAAALADLGDGPLAVRSSGVAEDLAGRSFAGQYESVLDVRGLDATLAAIRTCWASAYADRVAAYRGGADADPQLAVLVQRLVPADASGVGFSANPVTADPDEILVSAVPGLAEALMAGERSADEWRIRQAEPTLVASADPAGPTAIDAGQATAVAALARAVAAHYGTPQDIEWAYAENQLFLLQARPITTLRDVERIPIPIEEPAHFAVRDATAARPWTRLQTSLFLPVFSGAARHAFRFTTGALPYASAIGGWVYLVTPAVEPAVQLRRLEEIADRLAASEPRRLVERWNAEWRPAFRDRIAVLRQVEPGTLDDDALLAHLGDLIALFQRLHDVYFRLAGASVALLAELGVTAQDLLGWTPAQVLRLRGGLTGDHVAATTGLGDLARMAAQRPAVRRLVEECPPDAPERLPAADPEFARAFQRYRDEYGHRTIGFDLTEPTLAEQPGILLNLVRAQLGEPFDLDRERAALRSRRDAVLAEAGEAARQPRFAAALAGSDLATPVRDEKVFYAVSLWALLRYALLDLGRRMAAAGLTDRADDVWHLHLDTALAALATGADLRAEVRVGRGRHAWASAHPGPPHYGPPPVPIPADADLPEPSAGARHAAELAQWSMSLTGGVGAARASGGSLSGLAASAGRYTGPARVIRDVTQFGKLRRGDVLVCPQTTAQWAVLFPNVGALVTDHGSVLSHPAIISREYGVPAVLATGTATTTFSDGQLITVDGSAGLVHPADLLEGISR